MDETIIYREFAHADGALTVYIQTLAEYEDDMREMLQTIGYWGQASSFACCTGIDRVAPDPVECLVPLHAFGGDDLAEKLFVSFVSKFRNGQLCWEEVMPILDSNKTSSLKIEIYVWPMVVLERQGGNTILLRRSQTFFEQQTSNRVGGGARVEKSSVNN